MEEKTLDKATGTTNGVGYCVWGLFAILAGIFAFGIPFGLLAAHLGTQGIKRGAITFGKIVKFGGWAEAILTALAVVVMIAANPRVA